MSNIVPTAKGPFSNTPESFSRPEGRSLARRQNAEVARGLVTATRVQAAGNVAGTAMQMTSMLSREELGLSASEVARRAQIAKGTITRLELGQIGSPRMGNLRSIADVLQIPLTNLLAESRVLRGSDLPTLQPYLRTKFKDMPESAVREIEEHFKAVTTRHGIDTTSGPAPGEDE